VGTNGLKSIKATNTKDHSSLDEEKKARVFFNYLVIMFCDGFKNVNIRE